MKDWNAIARAAGLGLTDAEIARIAAPLDALEHAFRPLVHDLTPFLEPAIEFRAGEDE